MLGIVFDVDDTLYEQILPFKKACQKVLKEEIDIEKMYHRSRYYSDLKFEDSRNGTMTMKEYHIYRVQKAAEDLGVFLSDEEAYEFQLEYKKNQAHLEIPKELENLLEKLAKDKNIKLGIITNGPSEHQWFKVKSLELEKYIPKGNIIVSYDVGINKPDKKIFEEMEKRLNLDNDKLLYVGDSLENDVGGANAAKWKVIWINRYNNKVPKKFEIYEIAKTNKEIVNLVEKFIKENI